MVQGQYTLSFLFTDFFFFKQTIFCALALFSETLRAYNSYNLNSVTAGVFLKY